MADVERPEITRGHLDECLAHFAREFSVKTPKGSRNAARAKEPLAEFCGIGVPTVTRWFNDKASLPKGEALLKLMFFLDLVGYRVLELENMKPTYRNFAGLIAFGLMTSDEAVEVLGYAEQAGLYRVLYGKVGTSADKRRKMWDLWQAKRAKLEEMKVGARKKYCQEPAPAVEPETVSTSPATKNSDYAATFKIMEALSALIERDGLCGLPNKELAELRRTGGEVILRLSAQLSGLSSRLLASGCRKGAG